MFIKTSGVFDLGVYVFDNKMNMVTFGSKQLCAILVDENISSYKYQLSVKTRSKKKADVMCTTQDRMHGSDDKDGNSNNRKTIESSDRSKISKRKMPSRKYSEFSNSGCEGKELYSSAEIVRPVEGTELATSTSERKLKRGKLAIYTPARTLSSRLINTRLTPLANMPVTTERLGPSGWRSGFDHSPSGPELSPNNSYVWYDLETHEFLSKVVDEQVLRIFQGCVQRVDCDAFGDTLDFRFLYAVVAGGQNIAAIKDDIVGLAHEIMSIDRVHQHLNKFTAAAANLSAAAKTKSSSRACPEPIYPPYSLPITLIALAKYITDIFPSHFGRARNMCSIDKETLMSTPTRHDYDNATASRPYSISNLMESPGYTPPMGLHTPSPFAHNATMPVTSGTSKRHTRPSHNGPSHSGPSHSGPSHSGLLQTPSGLRQTLGTGQLASVIHSTIRTSKVSGGRTPSSSPTPKSFSTTGRSYPLPNDQLPKDQTLNDQILNDQLLDETTSDDDEQDCVSRYGLSPTMGSMRPTDVPKRCSMFSPLSRPTLSPSTTPNPCPYLTSSSLDGGPGLGLDRAGLDGRGLDRTGLNGPGFDRSRLDKSLLSTPSLPTPTLNTPNRRSLVVESPQMSSRTAMRLLTPDSAIHTPSPGDLLPTPKLVKWAASPVTPPTYTPSVMSTISVRSAMEDPCNVPGKRKPTCCHQQVVVRSQLHSAQAKLCFV